MVWHPGEICHSCRKHVMPSRREIYAICHHPSLLLGIKTWFQFWPFSFLNLNSWLFTYLPPGVFCMFCGVLTADLFKAACMFATGVSGAAFGVPGPAAPCFGVPGCVGDLLLTATGDPNGDVPAWKIHKTFSVTRPTIDTFLVKGPITKMFIF